MRLFCFICSSAINIFRDLGQLIGWQRWIVLQPLWNFWMYSIPGQTETEGYSVHQLRTKIHLGQYLPVQSECLEYNSEPMWNSIICSVHGKVLHSLAMWRITFANKILLLTLNVSPTSLPWCFPVLVLGETVSWCLMFMLSPVENCTHPDLRLCPLNTSCKDRWRCQNPCRRDAGAPSGKDAGLPFRGNH